MNWVFIINPVAGGGKHERQNWQNFYSELSATLGDIQFYYTNSIGDATTATRRFLKEGYKKIVAVGGDGTLSEVCSGFFSEDTKSLLATQDQSMAIIPGGSGSDFCRMFNLSSKKKLILDYLINHKMILADVGRLRFKNHDGKEDVTLFLNIADVGIGGEVMEILNHRGKGRVSWLSYQMASLEGILRYKNKKMHLKIDGEFKIDTECQGIVVANGRYFGSGMKVAPNAKVDDGLLDIIVLPAMNKFETILKFNKIRTGKHIYDPKIVCFQGQRVEILTDPSALLDNDGEVPGRTPAIFEIIPKALPLLVPTDFLN